MTGTQPSAVDRTIGAIVRLVIGLVCFIVGLLAAVWQLEHPPVDKHLIYLFVAIALFGALLLPSIFDVTFPRVQKIYILLFPNGLPIIGGRRSGDPPAPGTP